MSQATENTTGERLSGREAAIARRQALSLHGKTAAKGGNTTKPTSATEARIAARGTANNAPVANDAQPEPAASSCGCQHKYASTSSGTEEVSQPITPFPISAARQRRMEQSINGRGDAPACRPTGRTRPEPQKVEEGTTLAGTSVTGSQVERTPQVTGSEAGSCRTITGTEYIGAEQYSRFCGAIPAASPAKVATTSTSRGRQVTGTEVGRSSKVTGAESGTCKRVTGTEYLAAEQAKTFCDTTPEPHPEKAGMGMTAGRNTVTGNDLNRKSRVSGGESGSSRTITGSAYADAGGPIRSPRGDAPKKVETSHTSAGGTVSGTQLGRSSAVTGAEAGACERVTGSEYMSSEEFVSICRTTPYQAPAKVGMSRTLRGEEVTGTQVGRSSMVTGDEYGACKPVTGTSYIGADQYAEFCAARTAAEAINRAQLARSHALTGTQPGPDKKMTGNERGECQTVSGTPYLGEDQRAAACGGTAMATAMHARAQGPAGSQPARGITGNAMMGEPSREPSDFSLQSPARAAQARETARITGSAYGGSGRITGPMARATGLVSGTPEFRYREEAAAAMAPLAAAPVAAAAESNLERITGEGRERRITGDDWDRGDRITGTEGRSAVRRNPTQRGDPRGNGVNVRTLGEAERPVPATSSRVTGSSGNSQAGAAVTLSGGARG